MAGRRRLITSGDCRRYLAYIINKTESGEMDLTQGKGLAYIVSILLKSISNDDLESRLEKLEERVAAQEVPNL
jgi:hypothetical protein